MKVFISGSTSIKKLSKEVEQAINNIIEKNMKILIGDAYGVDSLVQEYLAKKEYYNVCIYYIDKAARNKKSEKFEEKRIEILDDAKVKSKKSAQMKKDEEMAKDCDYGLAIWDGKSDGTYRNMKRLLEKK